MDFSPKQLINSTLKEGTVYYYKDERLVKIDEPHYFIVTKIVDDSFIIMTCSTSQREKVEQFCEIRNISLSTIVYIKPDKNNGFTKDSYINCNNYFEEAKSSLIDKLTRGVGFEVKGYIDENILSQIKQGLIDSPRIEEEIKALL